MINKKGYSVGIPISDSGGIQTHDLQNFFLPRYQLLEKVLYDKKVTPVGFKPTTFRTFFFPDISYRKKSCMTNKKGYSASIPVSDSGGIQTHDLQNRNLTLYSTKLRDQNW